ncbi:hypothetical protein ANME2D_01567 [Candidatus Methanoperedens nitroreducens]|uniref:Uncharacterized protein n=1 Tax=Candidatus Methanoperedens nitratireducens TaxID=1392998 RepID=A0A062V6E4_9EURY|nr:hypothetical protein [Candidatus Methanoperedens nitroreducens]KCZ72163.1 hypothetical protein ANME2D_01567 [Candidatus Methanoperedens nitroreducens]
MRSILINRIREQGKKVCTECRSYDLEFYHQVYIEGELFSFPYCRQCGLVQWQVVSGFHLTLEKLYELYLRLADEFGLSKEKILLDLEYIKKRKGDEGYSDDVEILKDVFGRVWIKHYIKK